MSNKSRRVYAFYLLLIITGFLRNVRPCWSHPPEVTLLVLKWPGWDLNGPSDPRVQALGPKLHEDFHEDFIRLWYLCSGNAHTE